MRVQDVGILIVDDVNAMRIQIKEVLRKVGFEKFMLASNGVEAREVLVNNPIHLVLSDWHMEPTSGLELLTFIRGHSTLSALPFLMVTAESAKEEVIKAVVAGIDDYIVKPLTVAQVHEKVFKALIKRQVIS